LREVMNDYPRGDDAVAVGSELAANACLHSRSGSPGGIFTVSAEISEGDHTRIAVQDDGGSWTVQPGHVQPEHGLDLVQAIAGPGNWGIEGDEAGHLVWARLLWPGTGHREREPAGAPAGPGDDEDPRAELGKLAAALTAHGLQAQLVTPPGGPPHIEVLDPGQLKPPERVYAQADWFFWPTADRIAACDDITTATATIAATLRLGRQPEGTPTT
jgi:hypothetical protein